VNRTRPAPTVAEVSPVQLSRGTGQLGQQAAPGLEMLARRCPWRFAFLKETGIRKGDHLSCALQGDSVATRLRQTPLSGMVCWI
jgi:hypothetical protein